MIWRLQLWRLLGALAVLAVLSLAPQAASAHAGHKHSHYSDATPAMSQPAAPAARIAAIQDTAAKDIQAEPTQELIAAAPVAPDSDDTDGGQGCCCTGCHGFFAVSVPATAPPSLSSVLHLTDPLPHLGADGTKLRRPPKSFV